MRLAGWLRLSKVDGTWTDPFPPVCQHGPPSYGGHAQRRRHGCGPEMRGGRREHMN